MNGHTSEEPARHRGHLWMILCCTIPLLVIAAFALGIGRGSGAIYLLFLVCPLVHLLMHRSGHHGHDASEERS